MVVCSGFNAQGKRNRCSKTVSVMSKKELEDMYAKFKTEVRTGLFMNDKNLTFREFIETQWLNDMGVKNLAPKTIHRYKAMLTKRILPEIGHIKLSDINRNHITKLYDSITMGSRLEGKKGDLLGSNVLQHHKLLSRIFNNAVLWALIETSPMKMIKTPKYSPKITSFYDDEQVRLLLKHLNRLDKGQYQYKVITMLALFTGMRRGEIAGLEWKDVDFEKRTISICRTSQYLPGMGVYTKEPKTELSKRSITIPETIVELLKDYKSHQTNESQRLANQWKPTDRLFTTWKGDPMNPNDITDWFTKFVKDHKLPSATFHGLRHTNVSLMIADGVDVRTIASRVGHANPTTTLNLYSHMLRKSDQLASDSLEKRIMQGKKQPPSKGGS
jgi:integrase